jgi:hypothetical protein
MSFLSQFQEITEWIESHEKTVDLLKWMALGLAAWALGLFRYFRVRFRQPIATFEPFTSRCLIEEFDEFEGHKNAMRASFLVEVGLTNTTGEAVVIKEFTLDVRMTRTWRSWKRHLMALSLPARPRHETGASTKVLKNWFSNFQDDFRDLTLNGTVPAKHHESAFLLFVWFAAGNQVVRIEKETVRIRANVHLTTGEVRSVVGRTRVIRDKEQFEKWVPGILEQVGHSSAWGAAREA